MSSSANTVEVLAAAGIVELFEARIDGVVNLDEGEPFGLPGTYLNSVYELRPLPYAEAGYGYPESGQTVINVTNGKLIRLLVDDEPFDVRYGRLDAHERILDLRAGTLHREAVWTSPAGGGVRVTSTRLVSLTQRSVAAICYEVTPLDHGIRVVVQSELVANETLPAPPDGYTVATRLEVGQTLRLVKYLAYGWSAQRSRPAVHDQVMAAIAGAQLTGWDGLLGEQRAYLDEFWDGADVEVDGDPEIQARGERELDDADPTGAEGHGGREAGKREHGEAFSPTGLGC